MCLWGICIYVDKTLIKNELNFNKYTRLLYIIYLSTYIFLKTCYIFMGNCGFKFYGNSKLFEMTQSYQTRQGWQYIKTNGYQQPNKFKQSLLFF